MSRWHWPNYTYETTKAVPSKTQSLLSSSQISNIIHSWWKYSYYWLILFFFEEVTTYVHKLRVHKLNFSETASKFYTVITFVTADFRTLRNTCLNMFLIPVPNDTCLAPMVHYLTSIKSNVNKITHGSHLVILHFTHILGLFPYIFAEPQVSVASVTLHSFVYPLL